ncbi:MAG: indolepyruvate oxidoreductase subunit beta family protein [Hyphomicrobiales bacterium]|nr:indolepyruvate oxidoreductase subunit beta family protein [Hyphomicrobiales bacterium]
MDVNILDGPTVDAPGAAVRPISIAIFALGGEGGGVLADWLVDLAQHGGYLAQATSVPGVAQRTGATVYYVELFPEQVAIAAGREPVLALMPVPGDVAIVLASELMEAARAIERGFVTADETLLVTSTHRMFAMTEKIALGDGRVDSTALLSACRDAARQLIAFDMAAIAEATGSALSAVMLGTLAGSGALPFPRAAFEGAIKRGGVGVKASLAAFAAGFEAAHGAAAPTVAPPTTPSDRSAALQPLMSEVERDYQGEARTVVTAALERLVDYQDPAYAQELLARLTRFKSWANTPLPAEVARQLALAMAYEDTVRVADLKIRAGRFARVREEVGLAEGQILEIAEFFHPRTEEIADTLPAGLGRWLLRTSWARRVVDRLTRRGRIVKTSSVGGFLLLYALSSLKPLRRRSLRFADEQVAIERWLDLVADTATRDPALALEVARMRGLVRGYGDTHARGRAKYEKLAAVLPSLHGRSDAAATLSSLIKAALADEEGRALTAAIAGLTTGESGSIPARAP